MKNVKHRNSILITLFSLTLIMLLFQNCTSGEGLYSSGSLTDPFITDPPRIFVSKTHGCLVTEQNFRIGDRIFVCVEQAGLRPQYCISNNQIDCYHRGPISQQTGWALLPGEKWISEHSSAQVGTFTAYVTHTDDQSAVGQIMFTVAP